MEQLSTNPSSFKNDELSISVAKKQAGFCTFQEKKRGKIL
jgi:hypothetical protein